MSSLSLYLSNIESRLTLLSKLKFILILGFTAFLSKVLAIPFIYFAPNFSHQDYLLTRYSDFSIVFGALVLSPVFETFIGQWLPISLAGFFTRKKVILILISATFFSLAHGISQVIIANFFVGLILAWSFLLKQKTSVWEAIGATIGIHFVQNLLSLVFWLVDINSL